MGPLIDVVKEAVLAAVREELAAHKEEVDELRHMLKAVEERNGVIAATMEEKERELVVVKGELATTKKELAEHKQSTKLQLEEVEEKRVAEMKDMRRQVEEGERELAEHKEAVKEKWDVAESKKDLDLRELKDEMRAEFAREREERRKEVRGLNWPRAMEELAACKEWQMIQDVKSNIDLEIQQSDGIWKVACQVGASLPRSILTVHSASCPDAIAVATAAATAAFGASIHILPPQAVLRGRRGTAVEGTGGGAAAKTLLALKPMPHNPPFCSPALRPSPVQFHHAPPANN
ncbi:unnamed protein product [Closterium sp. Naga37s-1]|nr:unnamed protein product [Closterium sp. Naga37s-1]